MMLAFVLDAPTTLAADDGGSWVQLAKTGRFKDRRYGPFEITSRTFDSWIQNFMKLNPEGLPVDVDHSPEKKGETEAAGWVKKLEKRGTELWGFVEWNSLGRQLIADQRYKFLSPSYDEHLRGEDGRDLGNAMVGAALTNRPFLSMSVVSLSRETAFAERVGDAETTDPGMSPRVESGDDAARVSETSDSPSQMELSKEIREALGLPADGDVEATKVLEAINGLKTEPEAKTLDALAKEEGKIVLDAAKVQELVSDAAAGKAAAEELKNQKFETVFTKTLSEGRVAPAQKETFKALYDAAPDQTIKTLDELPQIVNTAPQGGGNGTMTSLDNAGEFADGEFKVDEESLEIHNKAITLSKEQNIEYLDAVSQIMAGAR